MKLKKVCIVASIVLLGCALVFTVGTLHVNTKTNQLMKAIQQNDINEASELVANNKQCVNRLDSLFPRLSVMLDDSVIYPLQEACHEGCYEIVQMLLENGADVNCVDPTIHSTPLIMALRSNHQNRFEIADLLIKNGADMITVTDDHNENALSAATWLSLQPDESEKEKSKQMFQIVLDAYMQQGMNIKDVKYRCGNIYLTACNNGNVAVVEYLLDHDFYEIDETSQDSKTALIVAVQAERVEVVKYLVDNRADMQAVDANGNTAYDYAIEKQNEEIIEMLNPSNS
ncbi:MAG: ankyrin repeat domain-containing protein [Oscillospiraceae bacterium]|nr:ankyrin repeat domain-containing protein [Oscillospiraceae bacterium]